MKSTNEMENKKGDLIIKKKRGGFLNTGDAKIIVEEIQEIL